MFVGKRQKEEGSTGVVGATLVENINLVRYLGGSRFRGVLLYGFSGKSLYGLAV